MRILIIRHGDPNYEADCLTEKGQREVELLAERLTHEKIDYFYVSPYRRARQTAEPTLKRFHRDEVICDWLHEFSYPITLEDGTQRDIPWDRKPSQWTKYPENFSVSDWRETQATRSGDIQDKYDEVIRQLDACLAEHGYQREGMYYRAEHANTDTIAFFLNDPPKMVHRSTLAGFEMA